MTRYPYRVITKCDVLVEHDMVTWCTQCCLYLWDCRYYSWRHTYWLFEDWSDYTSFRLAWHEHVTWLGHHEHDTA